MDHEKLGMFSLFLKEAYEGTAPVNVVQKKRSKMLLRLDLLRNACIEKEYEKANYVLLDICDKLLNDPYLDEYNIKQVEIEMIVFSSAVLSITVKQFERVEQIMGSLIMKYQNPLFYYVLGVSYFYDLSFKKAQHQFDVVMQLLSGNKTTKFLWPDSDVLIIKLGGDKIMEHASVFIKAITLLKKIKRVRTLTVTEIIEGMAVAKDDSTININTAIGKAIQYDVYPYIQTILGQLVRFDKNKLPMEFRRVLPDAHLSSINIKIPAQEKESKKGKKASVNCECKQKLKANEPDKQQTGAKINVATTSSASNTEGNVKKNEMVQVQPTMKCKLVQTSTKTVNEQTQTTEDMTGIAFKSKSDSEQETVLVLKAKLQQMTIKLKEAETKLAKSKNDVEINEKNKLITEQQDIISGLKQKLQQANNQHKDLGSKLSKMNGKVAELGRTNKLIQAESDKHKETISELRNYNQMLERSAKDAGKKQDELQMIEKQLFEKYRNAYFIQIKYYQNFHKRCENMLSVLHSISNCLTEITVPTKADCQQSINEWFMAMVSSLDIIENSKKMYHKYDRYISHTSLVELSKMPLVTALEEPKDVLMESVPMLVYTIKDFEKMLQNNRNKSRRDKNNQGSTQENNEANSGGETDYRKKSNFIHKSNQAISSNDGASSFFDKSPTMKFNLKAENSSQKGSDTNARGLIFYLKRNIPYRSEEDIMGALNICRKNNYDSLSGLAVQYILYSVLEILDNFRSPEKAWSAVKDDLDQLDDKDVCPICIEPVQDEGKTILTCRHIYHTECIREWLAVNRVCAVCRNYTVLDDEFPPLKNPEHVGAGPIY